MNMEEIFTLLGENVLDSVHEVKDWKSALLKIKRLEKNAGFESFYIDANGKEIPVDTCVSYKTAKAVHKLYEITQSHPLEHRKLEQSYFYVVS